MINRPKKFAKNNDIWNIKTKFSKNKGILSKYTPIKYNQYFKTINIFTFCTIFDFVKYFTKVAFMSGASSNCNK